jgi:hypothetical protein
VQDGVPPPLTIASTAVLCFGRHFRVRYGGARTARSSSRALANGTEGAEAGAFVRAAPSWLAIIKYTSDALDMVRVAAPLSDLFESLMVTTTMSSRPFSLGFN